jgi:Flp pilus assembly CpaE family ATPase
MQERKVLLIEDNLGDARLVQEMLAESGNHAFRIHTADCLLAALDALAHDAFDVALVDLSLPDSHGLETLLTIQRHAPGLPVVALTGLDSDSMALAAVERGAQDYLVKGSLTASSLVRALQYAVVRRQNAPRSADAEPATVLGILGAKGGVGATTIACHYAVELQRQTQKKVLLLDLDASAASASFFMKASSEFTVAEASTSLHRLDASLWSRLVCSTSCGVDLLRSPGAAGFQDQLDGERVRHVLRFARGLYGHIVVDLGRLNAFSLDVIEEMGGLLLVTTPELPSLFETGRVLKKLNELGVHNQSTHLLINRSSKAAPCSPADLARAFGRPIAAAFGDYTSELHFAHSEGKYLGEPPQLSKQIQQLVAKLIGVPLPEPARTGLGLFRFART